MVPTCCISEPSANLARESASPKNDLTVIIYIYIYKIYMYIYIYIYMCVCVLDYVGITSGWLTAAESHALLGILLTTSIWSLGAPYGPYAKLETKHTQVDLSHSTHMAQPQGDGNFRGENSVVFQKPKRKLQALQSAGVGLAHDAARRLPQGCSKTSKVWCGKPNETRPNNKPYTYIYIYIYVYIYIYMCVCVVFL